MSALARFRHRISWLFTFTVILPVLVSTIYFGILASDVYISESQFVVRSPEKPAASGLGILLQSAGFSNAGEEAYTANAYVTSRDALHMLNKNGAYQAAYSRPSISLANRFNPTKFYGSFEDLYRYFSSRVQITTDATTSISTLTVRAYTPEDAYKINRQLLQMSENMVNELNVRGQRDLVKYATIEVSLAKKQAEQAAIALAQLRTHSGIVDPEKQAEIQLQMISKLQDQLISNKAQLEQLQAFTPQNPQIPLLKERISALQGEISAQSGQLVGGRKSLAKSAVEFQRRMLENTLAEKQLASALASLADAKNEARRQQVYIERIVDPNLPDVPLEPRRLRGILATLAIGLAAWGILSMLYAGVREHGN